MKKAKIRKTSKNVSVNGQICPVIPWGPRFPGWEQLVSNITLAITKHLHKNKYDNTVKCKLQQHQMYYNVPYMSIMVYTILINCNYSATCQSCWVRERKQSD